MMTLLEKLKNGLARERFSAHMPGHKYRALHAANWYQVDTTEIDGTDNLFAADGILAQSMADIAAIYGVAATRLLVNGSTVGLLSAILANSAPGDTILIGRDSHKAVFNACQLGQLNSQTVMPKLAKSGISLGYDCDEIIAQLEQNSAIKLVVLTSPSYYGYTTDVSKIVEKLNARAGLLIVDEAHGAHLKFCQNGGSTVEQGAHIVVQSAHKMLAALTQSAMLHYNNGLPSAVIERVDHYLEMLQSSSPSYLLMSSIDCAVKDMQAKRAEHLKFERQLCRIVEAQLSDWLPTQLPQDRFKLWLETARCGYSGLTFEKHLQDAGIFAELANDWGVLLYLSHYNTVADLEAIVEAVKAFAKTAPHPATPIVFNRSTERLVDTNGYNIVALPLERAIGYYVAEDVIPYPPGIRLVMTGEKLTADQIKTIIKLRAAGHTIIGMADRRLLTIRVYEEM